MTEVLQCDRDRAADILDEIASLIQDDGIGQVADLIRDGEYDDHHTVAQVAAHREAEHERAKLDIATAFDCGHKEGVEEERQAVVDCIPDAIGIYRIVRAAGRKQAVIAEAVTEELDRVKQAIARGDHRKG